MDAPSVMRHWIHPTGSTMSTSLSITWLRMASALTLLLGLTAALAAHPATDGAWHALLDVVQWPFDGQPGPFGPVERQLSAVLGGVMVGWAVTLLALTFGPLQSHPRDIARIAGLGLFTWFLVDSAGSVVAGLPGNVLLNAASLSLFLPPLLALGRAPAGR